MRRQHDGLLAVPDIALAEEIELEATTAQLIKRATCLWVSESIGIAAIISKVHGGMLSRFPMSAALTK